MQFKILIFSLILVAIGLPAIAQPETAAVIDAYDGDKRTPGTVAWSIEQVKTPDGRDDPAIRADVDVPGSNLKLKMTIRRSLNASDAASHIIDLAFTVPPDFMSGGGLAEVFGIALASGEMSRNKSYPLAKTWKTTVTGYHFVSLSDNPVNICKNIAMLNDNEWITILMGGALPHRHMIEPLLWFAKGDAGRKVFDTVFAALEKKPEASARGAVCEPS